MQIRKCVLACALTTALSLMSQSANTAESAVWYNARHGDAAAMNQLGVWYYSGNKVERDYSQAYQWWSKGALAGNAKATANLGVCYQYGRGVEADSVVAMQLYIRAISDGQHELLSQRMANVSTSPFDAMLAGTCYERGIGVTRDLNKAAEMYTHAADLGSSDGMRHAADALMSAGEASQALQMYDRAARLGDVESTYMAGYLRYEGKGVVADAGQGLQMITQAADAGLPRAQGYLGSLYLNGRGVARDLDKAVRLLQDASVSGDQDAMWQYGLALKQAGDYDRALYWLSMASQAAGRQMLKDMYASLSKDDPFRLYIDGMRHYVNGNYPQAIMFFKDIEPSQSTSGRVMEAAAMAAPANPKGDAKRAVKNLTKLSDTSQHAAYVLAGLYMRGIGADVDMAKAISLYRTAANAGYGPAQDTLGDIYYDGKGTSKDLDGAIRLYDKAYAQHMLSNTGAERLKAHFAGSDPVRSAQLETYDGTDPVAVTLKAL